LEFGEGFPLVALMYTQRECESVDLQKIDIVSRTFRTALDPACLSRWLDL
jgi:hypothetical protein